MWSTANCVVSKSSKLPEGQGASDPESVEAAGLFPTQDQLEDFARAMNWVLDPPEPTDAHFHLRFMKFSAVLEEYAQIVDTDESKMYFLCDLREITAVAKVLDSIAIPFTDRWARYSISLMKLSNLSHGPLRNRYMFCLAPVDVTNTVVRSWFRSYARRVNAPYPASRLIHFRNSYLILSGLLWLSVCQTSGGWGQRVGRIRGDDFRPRRCAP